MKKPIIVTALSVFLAAVLAINTVAVTSRKSASEQVFDFEKEGYANAFDKLMADDGFVYGIDYNYMGGNTSQFASLAKNNIIGNAPSFNEYLANVDVYNMKAFGFNAIGWWLLGHAEGVYFDEDGYATGLDPEFTENLRTLLDVCRKYDMKMVPLLLTHGCANNYGNGSGTESATEIVHKYFKYYWDQSARDDLIENVINPILDVFTEYQDVVIAVSLMVENASGLVQDADAGYSRGNTGTTWENWKKLVSDLNAAVKAKLPNMYTTIEEAGPADEQSGTQEVLYRQNELDVDFISHNYYHSTGYIMNHGAGMVTKPGFIGEYNGGGPGDSDAEYYGKVKSNFMQSAKDGGWLGSFFFSWQAGGVDYQFMTGTTTNYESFHGWTSAMKYKMTDMQNEHDGITRGTVEASTLLANKGSSDVYWIVGRGTTHSDLLRSDDGGKTWKTVAKDIDHDTASIDNGFVKYTDTGVSAGMNFCYKVVSYDDEGNSATSKPNNCEDFFEAKDIMVNGGFEDELNGWENNSNRGGVLTTEDAASGTYALKIDKESGEIGTNYGATSIDVPVEPKKQYLLTFKYKVTKAAAGDGSGPYVQIVDDKGQNICYAAYYGGAVTDTEVDNGWASTGMIFSSNELTSVRVRIVNGSKPVFTAYVDDFEIKESR